MCLTPIRLNFTPEGGRDAVNVMDRVDADGDPIAEGESVEVAYSADAPRRAEIVGRSRAFASAERLALYRRVTDLATGVALLCVVVTGLYALARRRARARYSGVAAGRRGAKTNF
jgi:hypothetical protein